MVISSRDQPTVTHRLRLRHCETGGGVYQPVYGRALFEALRMRGLEPVSLLERAGVATELLDNGMPLSAANLESVLREARGENYDYGVGFEWGSLCQIGVHGIASAALLCSSNFQTALSVFERFSQARTTSAAFRLKGGATECTLEYVSLLPVGELRTLQTFGASVMMMNVFKHLIGSHLADIRVLMPYPASKWSKEWALYLPCEVEFGSDRLKFIFPNNLLCYENPVSDRETFDLATKQLALRCMQADSDVAYRVKTHITLQDGRFATLPEVSQALCLSGRSLSRALQREGTSYYEILESVRAERAVNMLTGSRLSVEQIACRLGYTDTSNFIRAFRRWHGCTPHQYRNCC